MVVECRSVTVEGVQRNIVYYLIIIFHYDLLLSITPKMTIYIYIRIYIEMYKCILPSMFIMI